jgi:acetate kinase
MMHTAKSIILVINTGSSSVKFQLFLQDPNLPLLAKGQIGNLGIFPSFRVTMKPSDQEPHTVTQESLPDDSTHEKAIHTILQWIEAQNQNWHISLVAHRVVHGGLKFTSSVKITDEVLAELWTFSALAPLHQSHNLKAITIISEQRPDVMQIACFDTAFHTNHKALFTEYALPQKIRDQGIRRYGFHGLSYEWVVHSLRQNEPELANGRIIAAHLGNGASLCAIDHGVSIDTTMGMMAVALGGIDCIVFTGGIGENSDFVRDNIVNRLAFLQPFATRIIPANEERIMAMHSIALIKQT